MQLKVYSVFDSKIGAFMPPIYMRNKGEALRSFQATVAQADHQFAKYHQDFTLFELGTWDDSNAKFIQYATPMSIGLASEFIQQKDEVQNVVSNEVNAETSKSFISKIKEGLMSKSVS